MLALVDATGGRSTGTTESWESTSALREGLCTSVSSRSGKTSEASVTTALRERLATGRSSRSRKSTESTMSTRETTEALVEGLRTSVSRRARGSESTNLTHYSVFTLWSMEIDPCYSVGTRLDIRSSNDTYPERVQR
uniref:Uncharacterized protein n=1 Tax=Anopheles culicifacies TaxID=139723 RepID=A0A182MT74_9DIPT